MHFPEGPPVAGPWTAPGTTNSESELRRLAQASEEDELDQEQHCSAQRQVCEGTAAVTERQKRLIRKLAHTFPGSAPDMEDITYAEVRACLRACLPTNDLLLRWSSRALGSAPLCSALLSSAMPVQIHAVPTSHRVRGPLANLTCSLCVL
jgi:hypothetical protein